MADEAKLYRERANVERAIAADMTLPNVRNRALHSAALPDELAGQAERARAGAEARQGCTAYSSSIAQPSEKTRAAMHNKRLLEGTLSAEYGRAFQASSPKTQAGVEPAFLFPKRRGNTVDSGMNHQGGTWVDRPVVRWTL